MLLYHGSNTANIKVLKPNQADHDRPYVYMTTIDVVAAFYLCRAVKRPYYWFPYGFENGSEIPVYHELYPNALKEVSEGVSGIYLQNPRRRKSSYPLQKYSVCKIGDRTR